MAGGGACVAKGVCVQGVRGRGGGVGGMWACVAGGMVEGGVHGGEPATEVGDMHPTGMHSCYRCEYLTAFSMNLSASDVAFGPLHLKLLWLNGQVKSSH